MRSLDLDDILVVLHKATDVIKYIKAFYREKEGSIKPPDIYLGANIMKVQMPDGCEVCTICMTRSEERRAYRVCTRYA